jgi:hypothetical protein
MNALLKHASALLHGKPTRLTTVYLAGKIRKNCWRHTLVAGLREHHWNFGPLKQDEFVYVGPFFVGCDHGCYHQVSSHGNGSGCTHNQEASQPHVAELCRTAIRKADLLFCYLDSADCYGTIAEIERAHVYGVPVVIAFAPNIATEKSNDFWFVCTAAKQVHYGVDENQLSTLLKASIKEAA